MTCSARTRKKLGIKNSKFKSTNQKITVGKQKGFKLKLMQNPSADIINDLIVDSKQTGNMLGSKVQIKDLKVVLGKQSDRRECRAVRKQAIEKKKAQAIEKKKAQVQEREFRAQRRALRLAREWEEKSEKDRKLQKEKENSILENKVQNEKTKTPLMEKPKTASIGKTKNASIETTESAVTEENPPKDKSKTEKELRLEAREKIREEEERKQEEEYWPQWDEMKKTKKKRKRTADRIVFKKSDYNMTDSDESSDDEDDSRYAPAKTPEPAKPAVFKKPAAPTKPTKYIPAWAQGAFLNEALEKQSNLSFHDLDGLFFSPVDMPDLSLMFPKHKKKFVRRTSSAVWLAPPPATFRFSSVA